MQLSSELKSSYSCISIIFDRFVYCRGAVLQTEKFIA
jgi:hypothetical protein